MPFELTNITIVNGPTKPLGQMSSGQKVRAPGERFNRLKSFISGKTEKTKWGRKKSFLCRHLEIFYCRDRKGGLLRLCRPAAAAEAFKSFQLFLFCNVPTENNVAGLQIMPY